MRKYAVGRFRKRSFDPHLDDKGVQEWMTNRNIHVLGYFRFPAHSRHASKTPGTPANCRLG